MKKMFGILLLLLAALAGRADSTNQVFSTGTVNLAVPVNDQLGLTSTLDVGGISGSTTNFTVNLDITGGFNGSLYAYLVSPQDKMLVLLNPAGMGSGNYFGSGNKVSLNITAGGQLTYTWVSDSQTIAPLYLASAAFDAAPTSSTLADLDGSNPNGVWTLFVADLAGGGQSTLVSWSLSVVTVPEPQTWTIFGGGLAAGWLMIRRHRN